MVKDWQIIAQTIQARMAEKEPNIKIDDVVQWLGLSSTSVAYFYLLKLEELGFVKRVENGTKKTEWFLNWESK